MRLWHQKLIKKLPRQQLLGQHREICALRGNSWGKKHATVDYVFKYSPAYLVAFHSIVINEMIGRGYTVDELWFNPLYRGKKCEEYKFLSSIIGEFMIAAGLEGKEIYPEHNDAYLNECLENLKAKGVIIDDY